MIRTQIQLTEEQAKTLKKIASRRGKSVAELIRISVDEWIRSSAFVDPDEQRQRAIAAAGKLSGGPADLSAKHDQYFVESLEE
ncbi:MAG TPA: ribbon-helix-helix domain-containing protein [Anaerolineales bacterium]|jgi:hypothetical protein|nr:ribbon-helix-helix domain-containing protein [Anaerolineales bacterium]